MVHEDAREVPVGALDVGYPENLLRRRMSSSNQADPVLFKESHPLGDSQGLQAAGAGVQLDGGLARQYSGTGLCLALVLKMTEIHGGHVSVDSEVGI